MQNQYGLRLDIAGEGDGKFRKRFGSPGNGQNGAGIQDQTVVQNAQMVGGLEHMQHIPMDTIGEINPKLDIEATLAKDDSKNEEDGLREVYKRIDKQTYEFSTLVNG